MEIELPANGWRPRPQQMNAWAALEAGRKRVALAWHRRYGKDEVSLNWTAVSMMERVGTYWHLLPQQNQARKAIWNAVDARTGKRRIDQAFPHEIREVTRDNEMFIRFKNGSTWQVVGSDSYNSLVGSPPVGVVLSEYALSDPNSWAFLRPILADNGGWALFISTPRGNNHFAKLVRYAKENPDEWFGEVLSVEDTGAIPADVIDRERRELRAERGEREADAIIAQEYYCDFNAALPGAYYGSHMTQAEKDGRIGVFPWLPNIPVGTAWDLGHGDSTVIWFYQQLRSGHVRLIDVLEGSGVGIDWYCAKLREREYAYADHIWPHDGGHGNIRDIAGTGLEAQAKNLGVRPIRVLERDPTVQMGIQATRQMFPLLEFNAKPLPFKGETQDEANARMARACDALRQYRRVWDEKNQRMSDNPLHDWCFIGTVGVWTRNGMCQIMSLPQTGEVLTPWGMKQYHSPRITRRDASLVEVRFMDGLTVRCTPDHAFLTASGWISAEHLVPGTLIQSALTPSLGTSMEVCTGSGRVKRTLLGAASYFTARLGRMRLGQSLRAATSTIVTKIRGTTCSRIWSACRQMTTWLSHGNATRLAVQSTSQSLLASVPLSGIAQKRGVYGTSDKLKAQRAGLSGKEKSGHVPIAGQHSKLSFETTGTSTVSATTTAKQTFIASVERLSVRQDVWCLTVPEAESFCLENGAVVHNCSNTADALRYLARGRKPFYSAPLGGGHRATHAITD